MRAATLFLSLCLASAGGAAIAAGASPPPGRVGGTATPPAAATVPSFPEAGATLPGTVAGLAVTDQKGAGAGSTNALVRYGLLGQGVSATIQLYRPPLPDANLAALAMADLLREVHGGGLRVWDDRVVAVGGGNRPNARRVAYGGLAGGKVTVLAVARAGDWIARVQAHGPADRQAEVLGAADAALSGITWARPGGPDPVAAWAPAPCPEGPAGPAPEEVDVPFGLAAAVDGREALPARGIAWPADGNGVCVDRPLKAGGEEHAVLRVPAGGGAYATRFLVLLNDDGALVEVGQARGDGGMVGVVRRHDIAGTAVVGFTTAVPSRQHLEALFGVR